jgi:cytochrome c oxidase cbb3-type subunit 4
MPMTYESLAGFAQTWGLLYFVMIFIGVVIYAYAPKNKSKFEEAARIVLRDEEKKK